MSGSNEFTSQLALAATRALNALSNEVRGSLDSLRMTAPEYIKKAEEIAAKSAEYLAQGLSGELDLSVAQEAALRETWALELLAAQANEKGAQEAMRRAKKAIQIATDVGLKLAGIALAQVSGGASIAIAGAVGDAIKKLDEKM